MFTDVNEINILIIFIIAADYMDTLLKLLAYWASKNFPILKEIIGILN